MNSQWTIGQVAQWILEHRKKDAFVEYSSTDILRELVACVNNNSMLVVSSCDGKRIVGVVTYEKRYKTIFIHNILTTEVGVIKHMLQEFLKQYPGFGIEAQRHLKLKQFKNIPTLTERI